MAAEVTIVGCGVSGLSVGLCLLEEGYPVEIITDRLPNQTTSSIAAAIWFPYQVKPKEKANRWSLASYHKFAELCQVPEAGVSMIPLTVLVKEEEDAWWVDALPKGGIRKALPEELPTQFPLGFKVDAPLVETNIYLDYLLDQYKALGGKLTIQKVSDLSALSESPVVVNCTGLHARELLEDKELYPIHGQIVKVKPQAAVDCVLADFAFEGTEDRVAYVVPRRDCLVLGGTAIKGEEGTTPNPEITRGIIERCKDIQPDLAPVDIQTVQVGLRPGRTAIRLEQEGHIIHNYGHGGGGFTVSWGCAMEVSELVKAMMPNTSPAA